MDITNEGKITGEVAKALRHQAGLSQTAFWGAYAVTQPGGCRYEAGKFEIPVPVKRLIFAEHVAGLRLDASTDEAAAAVRKLGKR